MSEKILKALMQLFAIISKQGDGGGEVHDKYVRSFLLSQISIERFDNYFDQYITYKNKQKKSKGSGTSVKDSVRLLSICKRINKTLSQKQKSIVLVRICELIFLLEEDIKVRLEIVATIADVFKLNAQETEKIIAFSAINNSNDLSGTNGFQIHTNTFEKPNLPKKLVYELQSNNTLFFYNITSAKIILFRFFGKETVQLNGLEVKPLQTHILTDGASIRTSKNSIFFNQVLNNFRNIGNKEKVIFSADIPTHQFKNGKVALSHISIKEEGGTLFGIMGGSGAGKTTLLNVLSGLTLSKKVTIALNGHDIQSEEARANIGYIPQDDLLIEELSVFQNLYYNAKLINNEWDKATLRKRIVTVLKQLGLFEIRHIKVGNALNKKISGGQRKRLNIALELIREPLMLFVDEPTSGLSSKDSENVMDLLKLLSHSGKIIFVVIHQPSSSIFKLFDQLMILDQGGLPVYYGNPIESVIYFKTKTLQINQEIGECITCGNVNPEQIFDILEHKEVDEFGTHTSSRKITAERWNEFYKEEETIKRGKEKLTALNIKQKKVSTLKKSNPPPLFKQFLTFFSRDFLSRLNDKQYILIALLEAPILAFVLSFIIRSANHGDSDYQFGANENIPAYIFMLVIVALFVGLTISAEEIFKDRRILKRERFLRLSRFSYLFSKVSYLILLSALQSFLLVGVGNFILGITDSFMVYWAIIFSVFVFGNLIGLVLSATFKTIITIYIIIPLIIIPQMILSGAMFRFENLNKTIGGGHHVPMISRMMIANWGYESIMVEQFSTNTYQKYFLEYDQLLSEYSYRTNSLYPFLKDLLSNQLNNGFENSMPCSDTIFNTITFEINRPVIQRSKKLELKENCSIEIAASMVDELSDFYQEKHNKISRLKDAKIMELNTMLTKKGLNTIKQNSYNEDIAEIVQNTLTTKQFFIENSVVYQNYDLIYMRDHLLDNYSGSGNFMFLSYKSLFGINFSTFWYNLMIIWLFNLILFLILYTNLLKRLISLI